MLILKSFSFAIGSAVPMIMFILNINIQNNYINIFTDNLETYPYQPYGLISNNYYKIITWILIILILQHIIIKILLLIVD
jgi:hypothetical protein